MLPDTDERDQYAQIGHVRLAMHGRSIQRCHHQCGAPLSPIKCAKNVDTTLGDSAVWERRLAAEGYLEFVNSGLQFTRAGGSARSLLRSALLPLAPASYHVSRISDPSQRNRLTGCILYRVRRSVATTCTASRLSVRARSAPRRVSGSSAMQPCARPLLGRYPQETR